MPVIARTVILLALSNVFMTFAWYAHLRNLADRPWWIAALVSWAIALFEYLLQVPANRIGYTVLSPGPAQDPPGGHHPGGLRSVRDAVHAPTDPAGLPVGRPLPRGGSVLRVPGLGMIRVAGLVLALALAGAGA